MNKGTVEMLGKDFDTAFVAPNGIKKLRELILPRPCRASWWSRILHGSTGRRVAAGD